MDILIDAFGGDNAPEEVIAGTILALNERKNFNAVLVGKKDVIEKNLKGYSFDQSRVKILDAEDIITCEEEPTVAIRKKPASSICVAFKELKENADAKAFVSAGSTGAVLVGATLKLGRISGINRPALCPILPTIIDGKNVLLMDSCANADCKPINICQFAIMGSEYAKFLGVENPKVALLSNGAEDEKGNAFCHEVFPILKGMKTINFIGNIEARDILMGVADVVITDGFSGNVALKAMEGTVATIFKTLKREVNSSLKGKIGGLLLKKSFKVVKDKLDYTKKGGAIFLGVNKTVIKTHGSSRRSAFKMAVIQAADNAEFDLADKIKERLALEDLKFGE